MTTSDQGSSHASFAPTLDQLNTPHSCLLQFSVKNQTLVYTATLHLELLRHIPRFQRNSSHQDLDAGKGGKESSQQSSLQRHHLSKPPFPFPTLSFRILIWKRFTDFPWNFTNPTMRAHNALCHLAFVILGSQFKLPFLHLPIWVLY